MKTVVDYGKKFGIADDMPELLSFALGAKETTPLRLATAYGMIVNGGKRITPSLIDRVSDRDGKTIWKADARNCEGCIGVPWTPTLTPPDIPDVREQVEDPRTTYQMVSIMQGVVERGTAVKLRELGIPVAGKTGTTNESRDAWFMGFTPDLVCGVFVVFDDPKPLGSHETGASVAIPIFKEFIAAATKDKPATTFRVPPGLRMVRVNPETGALAVIGDKSSIWESFIPGTEPQEGQPRPILDGSVTGSASEGAAAALTPVLVDGSTAATTTTPPLVQPTIPTETPVQPAETAPPAPPPVSQTPPVAPHPPSPNTQGTGGLY